MPFPPQGLQDVSGASHAAAHQPAGGDAMAVDAVAATGSLRTLGLGAQQAMPGNTATGPAQATQAAIEAETNEDTYAPPDLIKNSPGVAKAWCRITAAGALEAPDYNVSTVTDTGTGDRTINWSTAFSGTVYAPTITIADDSGGGGDGRFMAFATGSIQLKIRSGADALIDQTTGQAFFGDQ